MTDRTRNPNRPGGSPENPREQSLGPDELMDEQQDAMDGEFAVDDRDAVVDDRGLEGDERERGDFAGDREGDELGSEPERMQKHTHGDEPGRPGGSGR